MSGPTTPLGEEELQANIAKICLIAVRAGTPVKRVLDALTRQHQRLVEAEPLITAALESQRSAT